MVEKNNQSIKTSKTQG